MSGLPRFRSALRITKYDPALRDESGAFTGDDWTSVSDVGGAFGGEILTLGRYLAVEGRHLLVVAEFLEEANVECTRARGVESYRDSWWPAEGQSLSCLETVDVVREMLRERGFCRLEGEANVYIHVGFDYYVFVGGDVPCERTLKTAAAAGLFIDADFTSPYQVDPETGELP